MGLVHCHVSQAFPSNYSSACDRHVARPAIAGQAGSKGYNHDDTSFPESRPVPGSLT
jgi:hypothetical protein